MSYSRWSKLLSRTPGQQAPPDCYERWRSESPKLGNYPDPTAWAAENDAWTDRFLNEHELELSSWYIYHHVDSGSTPDRQVLAVWSNNTKHMPKYTAKQLREIAEVDAWEQIPGYEAATTSDRLHIQNCIRQFLADTYGQEPGGETE